MKQEIRSQGENQQEAPLQKANETEGEWNEKDLQVTFSTEKNTETDVGGSTQLGCRCGKPESKGRTSDEPVMHKKHHPGT